LHFSSLRHEARAKSNKSFSSKPIPIEAAIPISITKSHLEIKLGVNLKGKVHDQLQLTNTEKCFEGTQVKSIGSIHNETESNVRISHGKVLQYTDHTMVFLGVCI